MYKGQYCGDRVGDKVYQLQLVVEEQTSEEIPSGDVEATLKEGRKDDLFLPIFVGNSSPTSAFHSTSAFGLNNPWSTRAWMFASVIVDGTHTIC
jgi:hypothetical protein